MVSTELPSDCAIQEPTGVNESNANTKTMTTLTDDTVKAERDDIYYWDTVKFLVEGYVFRVPRYQFVIGSSYFAGKLAFAERSDGGGDEAPVTLKGATASQFRVFLKMLFPIHTSSTTLEFSKDEWRIILELSTLWHFDDFRMLATEHLEPLLDDPIERIVLGRASYVPKWVLDGYESLVTRPECISEQESEAIGHLSTVRLYILRHERCFDLESLATRFHEEIHALEQIEKGHMSAEATRRAGDRMQEREMRRKREEEDMRGKNEEEERKKEEEEQQKQKEGEQTITEEMRRQWKKEQRRKKQEELREWQEEQEREEEQEMRKWGEEHQMKDWEEIRRKWKEEQRRKKRENLREWQEEQERAEEEEMRKWGEEHQMKDGEEIRREWKAEQRRKKQELLREWQEEQEREEDEKVRKWAEEQRMNKDETNMASTNGI